MKTLLSIFIVLIVASTAVAQTYVTSDILASEAWTPAGSPYIIQDNIRVAASAALTVQSSPSEGVTVAFEGYYSLVVEGSASITASGSSAPGGSAWT